MRDRRSSGILRVADTLVIAVGEAATSAAWCDDGVVDCGDGEGVDGRTQDCRSVDPSAGSGTWLGGEVVEGRSSAVDTAAAGEDGIQIICRYDTPSGASPPSSSPSSPPPYPPPPPPTDSLPTLSSTCEVSEFSSIIEIDGDSFCIRSRLAGREEPESSTEDSAEDCTEDCDDTDCEDANSEDEGVAMVARCRRFYESRLLPRWPGLLPVRPVDADDPAEERPTSVDSGRESGADSRQADPEDGGKPEPPAADSPLEIKMALLRREVSALMRQDNDLFRQMFALHDSIEALKTGEGSLSAGSSLSSLADIEEEDTISTPSSDLDRQSHLSSEADNFSLVKGDSGSERSFFSEILHVTGMSNWVKSRANGPESLTADQMAPPSPRQAASPSLPPAEKTVPRSRHRKQGSYDSGIVDQEIRGHA